VEDSNGVYFVPAFVGLGAPHWDPHARGAILGLTRGVNRSHLVRAALESIAFQGMEVVDCMARGREFLPRMSQGLRRKLVAGWERAVARSKSWAPPEEEE